MATPPPTDSDQFTGNSEIRLVYCKQIMLITCYIWVLVEANGVTRTLLMNRPKQLNALSSAMITGFLRCFTAYEEDEGVKLLIVKGKGRAFCAGGDVAAVVRSINNDSWKYSAHFFRNEFLLNYIIATYNKPQVSLLTGIVMGGGAGVSIHGRFRVVTESTVFAMPETALGLFPDIGASYFLSRLPGFYVVNYFPISYLLYSTELSHMII
ncbi:Os10g0572800 [Oryza sativa Japonica Group]|uniref:3-hydroxyisobutyryl-CoA hydrolase n=2 Tax=Oryza sativa subsp. japonica TaxID=39947 RepID=Q7XBZ1_ORYSJ|nr:3-hydroxyisobutyryl-coenzyme A hydrolase, putative [Oryza sativa Japonica Group]BAF27303.1 Os10g0572800 [Oryza sativa Japonica Group]|eukprot:NP_001065466.1 Os10g0572800 [Oryza sativa Japonica Group]